MMGKSAIFTRVQSPLIGEKKFFHRLENCRDIFHQKVIVRKGQSAYTQRVDALSTSASLAVFSSASDAPGSGASLAK